MDRVLEGVPVAVSMISMVLMIGLLAGLVALVAWGAAMFRVSIAVSKIAVACLAAYAATAIAISGIYPLMMRMASGASPMVGNIVSGLIIFGLPPLILAICLQIVGNLRKDEGPALAMFGNGGFTAIVAVLLLLLSAMIPTDMASLPFVSSGVEAFKNIVWIMLVIGGALMFAGYSIGAKLARRPHAGDGTGAGNVAPAGGTGPSNSSHSTNTSNGSGESVTGGTKVPPPPKPVPSRWLVLSDSNGGKRFDLAEGEALIGRSRVCTVCIPSDEEVGRQHARLRISKDKCLLSDLDSQNGTFLNNDRVLEPRVLQDGDTILVGKSTLVYKQV